MAELKPLTKVQTLEIMICETKNELTKCEIMERVAFRQSLKGSKNKAEEMMGMQQAKIRGFKSALADIEDLYKEALAEEKEKGDTK